jgi:hypothetical protein
MKEATPLEEIGITYFRTNWPNVEPTPRWVTKKWYNVFREGRFVCLNHVYVEKHEHLVRLCDHWSRLGWSYTPCLVTTEHQQTISNQSKGKG